MSQFVVVFHNGSIEGDCQELSLPTSTLIETFEQALSLITVDVIQSKMSIEGSDVDIDELQEESQEELQDCLSEFVGAYIVDTEVYKKYSEAFANINVGSDNECYAIQSVSKSLARSFALKSLGQKIQD